MTGTSIGIERRRGSSSSAGIVEVSIGSRPFELLADDVGGAAWTLLSAAREDARAALLGRTVWTVNSTAAGGGVAEMQRALLPYWRGSGLDVRWQVLRAPAPFFRLTKQLHNMLHGSGPSDRRLGPGAIDLYERVSRVAAASLLPAVSVGDVVILHDPQTAGLAPILKRAGAAVIWRCHVGAEIVNRLVEEAWEFLFPYVAAADWCVFTRKEFVPAVLDAGRVSVSAPAIDPRSPKNQALAPEVSQAVLCRCGLAACPDGQLASGAAGPAVSLAWGGKLRVDRRCEVLREDRPAQLGRDRLVVSLARWDRLKDPIGMLHTFAEHVHAPNARLVLAGPPVSTASDDPEDAAVLDAVRASWRGLPRAARKRIDVAVLPMVELAENAVIVNALQRHASVIVKKSLQEGFGLGVTEALWKVRPVVATNVGGHRDQIEPRRSGLLVDDPADLPAFGAAITALLEDPAEALTLGGTGREFVRNAFLADRHLVDWSSILCGAVEHAPSRNANVPFHQAPARKARRDRHPCARAATSAIPDGARSWRRDAVRQFTASAPSGVQVPPAKQRLVSVRASYTEKAPTGRRPSAMLPIPK